jgi:Uma2 family endonuclease
MATVIRKLIYADYERIPDDGFRHEIIEGSEFMTPAPDPDHQAILFNLVRLVGNHVVAGHLGRVLMAPTDVVLSEHDIVQPDLLFVTAQRTDIIGRRNVRGAPDLAVEVLSPSTAAQDRGPKLLLYARAGVLEYWIVDLVAGTIEIHEFTSPRRVRIYKAGQSFSSARLPGLTLRVDDILSV